MFRKLTAFSRPVFACSLLSAGAAGCGGAAPAPEEGTDEGLNEVGLPFSESRESGDLVYLAGALGNLPGTLDLVPGGIEAQTRQTMANLGAVLERRGMDFSRVAAVNVYLSDIRYFSEMNAVYREYFPEDPPTRATVEAGIAVPGALVEISMVAIRPGAERRVIRPERLKSPELPYSWGIASGDTLFVAGATARGPGHLPAGGRERHRADAADHGEHRHHPRSRRDGLRGCGELPGLPRRPARFPGDERGLPRVLPRRPAEPGDGGGAPRQPALHRGSPVRGQQRRAGSPVAGRAAVGEPAFAGDPGGRPALPLRHGAARARIGARTRRSRRGRSWDGSRRRSNSPGSVSPMWWTPPCSSRTCATTRR